MNTRLRWMLLSMSGSALLAGVAAWFVTDWALHRHAEHHHTHAQQAEEDLHAWMHAHLELTPEQHAAMEPGENAFALQRAQLTEKVKAAGIALAEAIRDSKDGKNPAIDAALQQLNQAQAELQRATIDHFFTMKRYLRPAQARTFLQWTHDSLARH